SFGHGQYFDVINVCEATAHELAASVRGGDSSSTAELPLRSLIGDPTDFGRRSMIAAISTLVLRHDRAHDTAEMILHWRDPSRVASGGGLYQVIPVGVFSRRRMHGGTSRMSSTFGTPSCVSWTR